jgi:hypothetical protein
MKKFSLLFIVMLLYVDAIGQLVSNLDEVCLISNNLSAVKKGNNWGFINEKGILIIDFRGDLVTTKIENSNQIDHPVFFDNRCMIRSEENNTTLFGFINETGKIVIEPGYVNATNFFNGYAIVIKLIHEKVGFNEVLQKDITTAKLEEYIIDVDGNEIKFLFNPRLYNPSKSLPKFHSKFVSPNIVAVLNSNGKWDLYSIN